MRDIVRIMLIATLCLMMASCGGDENENGTGQEEQAVHASDTATASEQVGMEEAAEVAEEETPDAVAVETDNAAVDSAVDALADQLAGQESAPSADDPGAMSVAEDTVQDRTDDAPDMAADVPAGDEAGQGDLSGEQATAEASDIQAGDADMQAAMEDPATPDGVADSAVQSDVEEGEVSEDATAGSGQPSSYADFVKQSVLYFDEERTVGQVIDEYAYFSGITWKEYEYQGRMMVEATATYDIPSALNALRDEDPEADDKFVGQSLGELSEVMTIMYFSVDKDMATLQPPSSSGLAHCKNGKTTTFMPGGVQLVYDNMPPRIKDVYRQCFN